MREVGTKKRLEEVKRQWKKVKRKEGMRWMRKVKINEKLKRGVMILEVGS